MATDDSPNGVEADEATDLTETESAALHEVELGLEWLLRAQGQLLAFHHATGHGMDHHREAERLLRAAEREALADALRDDLLPRGVVDGDRWSYDVVENYQETLLTDAQALERWARRELADGQRHVRERRQQRAWTERAGER